MRTIRNLLAIALAVNAALATRAHAQTSGRISFELRGGTAIPVLDNRNSVPPGWSLGGTVLIGIDSTLSLYAGYEHDQASNALKKFVGEGVPLRDRGFRAGAHFDIPEGRIGPAMVWMEIGTILNRASSGRNTVVGIGSPWKVGFEGGLGMVAPLSPRLSLTPGFRYRTHKIDSYGYLRAPESAKYISLDVGVRFRP